MFCLQQLGGHVRPQQLPRELHVGLAAARGRPAEQQQLADKGQLAQCGLRALHAPRGGGGVARQRLADAGGALGRLVEVLRGVLAGEAAAEGYIVGAQQG